MSGISNYLENALGNHTYRNSSYTSPGTGLYMSLHTATPGDDGLNEASGGSYARVQFTDWSAPANRAIINNSNIGFATLSGDLGTAVALGIWDASTSGNFLWCSDPISLALTSGSTPTFEAGNVIITLSDQISTYLAHKWLNHVFRNTAFTSPGTSLYVSLHTGSVGLSGGGEVVGNNYGRVQNTGWSAFSNGTSRNTGIVQFNTPSANWGTISDFGVYDASSSGNFLGGGPVAVPYEANSGDAGISFAASELSLVVS